MKDYIKLALTTESNDFEAIKSRVTDENIRLLHAGIGLATEAGETLDALKKHVFYGQDLDKGNLAEETGDLVWYLAIVLDVLGLSFDDIMEANIKKLKTRYPEGFTKHEALNRDTKKEMKNAGLDF